ncbi:MAG: cytochrome P450 [Acidimicrobiales bacterium]
MTEDVAKLAEQRAGRWADPAIDIDLGDRAVNADPDAFAAAMLAGDPIRRSERNRAWLLMSYKAVTEGFLDPRLSSDRTGAFARQVERRGAAFERTYELLSGWMVFRDPPTHTRLREPVRRAFTPRVMARLREAVEETVTELINALPAGVPVDLKAALATPLPALVIADLLGVPREERSRFQQWSDRLGEVVFSVETGQGADDGVVAATEEFISFFTSLMDHRRRHPGEDLISKVVNSGFDELTELEVVGACTLLLFAGHETTTNLLASSVRTLFDHPAAVAAIGSGAVEETFADELMRVAGPAKSMARKVAVAHERGGHRFEVGDTVFLVMLVANRDPLTFADPARLDVARDPNPQLGFGWGSHLCLGANLARLEGTIALSQLYRRFDVVSDGVPPAWRGNPLGRSIRELPVILTPR